MDWLILLSAPGRPQLCRITLLYVADSLPPILNKAGHYQPQDFVS